MLYLLSMSNRKKNLPAADLVGALADPLLSSVSKSDFLYSKKESVFYGTYVRRKNLRGLLQTFRT